MRRALFGTLPLVGAPQANAAVTEPTAPAPRPTAPTLEPASPLEPVAPQPVGSIDT